MKALITAILALAALACAAGAVSAESILVTEAWVKVRAEPAPGAKAIGLAYGNDRYELLDERSGWYRIRTPQGRAGWVPESAAYPVIRPIATKAMDFADSLRTTGRARLARARYFEIVERFPETAYSYRAALRLLSYHAVGELPAMENGAVPPGGHERVAELMPLLLIQEGRRRLAERRWADAVPMFQQARTYGVVNLSAMDGIREALQQEMRVAEASGDPEHIRVMTIALQDYFPRVPRSERHRFRYFDDAGLRLGAERPQPPPRPLKPIRPSRPLQHENGDAPTDTLDMEPMTPGEAGTAPMDAEPGAEPMEDEGMESEPMDAPPMDEENLGTEAMPQELEPVEPEPMEEGGENGMEGESMESDGMKGEEAAAADSLPEPEAGAEAAAIRAEGSQAAAPAGPAAPRELPPPAGPEAPDAGGDAVAAAPAVQFGPAAPAADPGPPPPPPSLKDLRERPAAEPPAE